jgi:type II secretory pathway pseudopilin PulG
MITILVMGIVLGIATSSWFGVIRSRNVDSATTQVAADLRLAHSQATNRLAEYKVLVSANSSTYQVGPTAGPLATKTLPDGTQTLAAADIRFKADGSATVFSGTTPITVKSSVDPNNNHTIQINTLTSEINVVP